MQAIYQQHILDAQQCSQLSVFMKKIFDTKNEITRLYCLIENDNFDFLKVGNTGASYHRTVAFAKILYNFCCLYFCSGFFFCITTFFVFLFWLSYFNQTRNLFHQSFSMLLKILLCCNNFRIFRDV